MSFADYDNDGDPDIYVVNDKVEHPIGNVLWRNDGAGCGGWCWSDASSETRTNYVRNGMGLAVGDYDNDLDLDFYFSDMGEPMSLLENLGDRFRNATRKDHRCGDRGGQYRRLGHCVLQLQQRRLAQPVPGDYQLC